MFGRPNNDNPNNERCEIKFIINHNNQSSSSSLSSSHHSNDIKCEGSKIAKEFSFML